MKSKKCPNCRMNNITLTEIFKKTLMLNYCSRCSFCNNGWSINKKFNSIYLFISPGIGVLLIFIFADMFHSISYGIFMGIFILYGIEILLNYLLPISKCMSPKEERYNLLIFPFVPMQIAIGFVVGGHIDDLIGFPYNILGFIIGFLVLPILIFMFKEIKNKDRVRDAS